MTARTGFIEITAGDTPRITRTVYDVPTGTTITLAWLTIKNAQGDADPGVLQKAITSTDVAGTGQITDTGSDTIGALRFDLTTTDTATTLSGRDYQYDIAVKTAAAGHYTIERGVFRINSQITTSTS